MIFESSLLKRVFDLIKIDDTPFLEIVITENNLKLAANYSDNYYIEYNITCSNDSSFVAVMRPESFDKLNQLVNFWPKSKIKIDYESEFHTIEIVDYGQLIREKPVQIDCIFEEGMKDYALKAPQIEPNCSINSKNFRQMLEFCKIQKNDILISIQNKCILINNSARTIGTKVESEEFFKDTRIVMKLSAEANSFIITFLNRLGIKSFSIYLIFIDKNYAFSIYTKLSDSETIQIYSIHD